MSKRTIGFFDDSVGPGGTTRYLSHLVDGINRDEYDLVFFAPKARAWHRDFESMGVEVVTLEEAAATDTISQTSNMPRPAGARRISLPKALSWWLGLAREVSQLRRLFKKRAVDLLHSNNAGAEPAPIAARLAGVPVVIATWHVDSTYDLGGIRSSLRYRLLEMACMRSLHHAIAVSHATAADWMRRCRLPEWYRGKLTVIHNGIPVESLRRRVPIEKAKAAAGLRDRFVIGSMGRLEAAKGYEYLIRALPVVVAACPNALLRIAGRGELQPELASLAHSLGVERHVEFTGFVADIQSFLEAIDVYVQPSLCEALPMAILEASAVGMPIVATDVGGVAECVREGETGFVLPPRDANVLASSIIRLAANARLRGTIAAEGQQLVARHFLRGNMVEATMRIYRKLTQK